MHNLSTDYKETIVRTADEICQNPSFLKPPTYNTTGHSKDLNVTQMTFHV